MRLLKNYLIGIGAGTLLMAGAIVTHGTRAAADCRDSYCPPTPFVTSTPPAPGDGTSHGTVTPTPSVTVTPPPGCTSRGC